MYVCRSLTVCNSFVSYGSIQLYCLSKTLIIIPECSDLKDENIFIFDIFVSSTYTDFVEFEVITDRKTGKLVASKIYKVISGMGDAIEEPVEGIVVKEVSIWGIFSVLERLFLLSFYRDPQ